MVRRLTAVTDDHLLFDSIAAHLTGRVGNNLCRIAFDEFNPDRASQHCLIVKCNGMLRDLFEIREFPNGRRLLHQHASGVDSKVDVVIAKELPQLLDVKPNAVCQQVLTSIASFV